MKDVGAAIQTIDEQCARLDLLSKHQDEVLVARERLAGYLEEWHAAYNRNWWVQHTTAGAKLPSEKLRSQLAVTDPNFPHDDARKLAELDAESERISKQIANTKALIDGYRSVLSALKLELEAVQ